MASNSLKLTNYHLVNRPAGHFKAVIFSKIRLGLGNEAVNRSLPNRTLSTGKQNALPKLIAIQ